MQLRGVGCSCFPKLSPSAAPSAAARDPFLPSVPGRPRCGPENPPGPPSLPSLPPPCPPTYSPGSHHLARVRAQLPHDAGALRPQPALGAHAATRAGARRGWSGGLRGGGGLAHGQHRANAHGCARRHPPFEQTQRPGARAAHLGHGRRQDALGGNAAGGRRLHPGQRSRCGNAADGRSGTGAHRRRAGDPGPGGGGGCTTIPTPTPASTRRPGPRRLPGQRMTSRDVACVRAPCGPRVNKPALCSRGAAPAAGTVGAVVPKPWGWVRRKQCAYAVYSMSTGSRRAALANVPQLRLRAEARALLN